MTITIITDLERATHIFKDGKGYYTAELFEVKDKLFPSQTGVRVTFPNDYTSDMVALLMFHVGISFGMDKMSNLHDNYKPNQFKNISVDGRN